VVGWRGGHDLCLDEGRYFYPTHFVRCRDHDHACGYDQGCHCCFGDVDPLRVDDAPTSIDLGATLVSFPSIVTGIVNGWTVSDHTDRDSAQVSPLSYDRACHRKSIYRGYPVTPYTHWPSGQSSHS
jgi:hypothetical protein